MGNKEFLAALIFLCLVSAAWGFGLAVVVLKGGF